MTDVVSPQPSIAFGRLRSVGGYAAAMYFVRLAAILEELLPGLGRPLHFGFVAAFFTFLTYSAYLDLGLFHAVYRELPMLRGSGNTPRITRMVDTAFGGSLLLGVGAAAALLVLSGVPGLQPRPRPLVDGGRSRARRLRTAARGGSVQRRPRRGAVQPARAGARVCGGRRPCRERPSPALPGARRAPSSSEASAWSSSSSSSG